jgi:serine/threonine-protein kinase
MTTSPPDDAALIAEASASHGVSVLSALRAGGQKMVMLVDSGAGQAVLKIVRVDATATGEALKRAHREAALLASISHPHVVKALTPAIELGIPPYAICWLEEALDGDDLRDIVGTPWGWTETQLMGQDVADALAELHRRGVVHRDVSAGNVRRLGSGSYKLLDPGFARHLHLSGLTGLHQPGTPGFCSPEHVQLGATPTPASDVFALGVLMWLALTGALPVQFVDPITYAEELATRQIPSIAGVRPDLTSAQVVVVDRCLQRQVARRYFDGDEVRAALGAL